MRWQENSSFANIGLQGLLAAVCKYAVLCGGLFILLFFLICLYAPNCLLCRFLHLAVTCLYTQQLRLYHQFGWLNTSNNITKFLQTSNYTKQKNRCYPVLLFYIHKRLGDNQVKVQARGFISA